MATARERSFPAVGNYLVDVKSFEELALPSIQPRPAQGQVRGWHDWVVNPYRCYSQMVPCSAIWTDWLRVDILIISLEMFAGSCPQFIFDRGRNRKDGIVQQIVHPSRPPTVRFTQRHSSSYSPCCWATEYSICRGNQRQTWRHSGWGRVSNLYYAKALWPQTQTCLLFTNIRQKLGLVRAGKSLTLH